MRVGLVVQRYGEEIVGGAELHARWIAQRLARRHQVEVLTTCATDYLSWDNVYEPGGSTVGGLPVRRFRTARRRTPEAFDPVTQRVHFFEHSDRDERRWMEEHGPVTPDLVQHLKRRQADYDALVFFSYRYWTAFHGLQVAPRKSILVPTAEDDGTVRLRLFRDFFRLPAAYAFNSPEERDMLTGVSGGVALPGEVVGVGIEDAPVVEPEEIRRRLDILGDYVIYVGRIEREKGCARLFDDFRRYLEERRASLTLVLVGKPVLTVPTHPSIVHLGVLGETEKLSLVRGARLLVHPSPLESLSMSLLEAWKMTRPALVNAKCAVLRGQVTRADGGLFYNGYEEFAAALDWLLQHPAQADLMGRSGRAYFERHYSWEVVMEKWERLLALARSGAGAVG
ncbi:MAG TPA: glycosyltransferase family 4 protein [Vicinamibacteria bacterium]